MRYIDIKKIERRGYFLNVGLYLEHLPSLLREIPEGAAAFVSESEHYEFGASKCVKDLRLSGVEIANPAEGMNVVAHFNSNPFKSDYALRLDYVGVREFRITGADSSVSNAGVDSGALGDVQLDEVLPTEGGCSHEISFTGGNWFIQCLDLLAEWYIPKR